MIGSTSPGRRRGARSVLSVVALAAAATISGWSAGSAVAAELPVSFSSPSVTVGVDPEGTGTVVDPSTPITVGQSLTFHTDWSLSGQANAGDTFEVPLPTSFQIASSAPFDLTGAAGTIATCSYSQPATAIVCTIVGGPHHDAEGDLWFVGSLLASSGEQGPSWTIGGTAVILPKPVPTQPGPYTPPFGTSKAGYGSIVDGKAVLDWGINLWPGTGPGPDEAVHAFDVVDTLSSTAPHSPHTFVPQSMNLQRWERARNADGSWASGPGVDTGVPGSWVVLAKYVDGVWTVDTAALKGETFSEPTVDQGTLTFALSDVDVPYQYRLSYRTTATGAVSFSTDVFGNQAVVNGEDETATARPQVYGGGGADATAYTSFSISKKLLGAGSTAMPESFTVTVEQAGETVETLQVPASGEVVNSGYHPVVDGPLTVCEAVPAVPGIAWAPYTVTGSGVTAVADGCWEIAPVGGQRIELHLTNTATTAVGTFSVTKLVEGSEAARALVKDQTYTVGYTVDGVPASPLSLRAGETVTSPELPVGANISLSELTVDVPGVTFRPEVFSARDFVIGGQRVVVTLTNTVEQAPSSSSSSSSTVPSPTVVVSSTSSSSSSAAAPSTTTTRPGSTTPLANTGSDAAGLAGLALVLLLLGGALVAVQRRRTHQH